MSILKKIVRYEVIVKSVAIYKIIVIAKIEHCCRYGDKKGAIFIARINYKIKY